jgi:hypothetical protein
MSFTFHNSLGPLAGHSLSRPVSVERPSRFGPRHCGQSAAVAGAAKARRMMDNAQAVPGRAAGFINLAICRYF